MIKRRKRYTASDIRRASLKAALAMVGVGIGFALAITLVSLPGLSS